MKFLRTVWRLFVVGNKNFFRNMWLSFAAIAVMMVALVIIFCTIVLSHTIKGAISEFSKNIKISVYINDEASDEQINKLRTKIKSNKNVDEIKFITKEEARQRFNESFQDDKELLSGLSLANDALPASLEISVKNIEFISEVSQIPQGEEFKEIVEEVSEGKTDVRKTIDRAKSLQRFLITAGVVSVAVFSLVAFMIIFNTIRMAIFARSDEIRIMKLIGATPWYIRGPFIVESGLYGVTAGLLASAAGHALVYFIGGKVSNQTEVVSSYQYFTDVVTIIEMTLLLVAGGIFVGVFSSFFAMRRYLRLKRW